MGGLVIKTVYQLAQVGAVTATEKFVIEEMHMSLADSILI